MSDELVLVVGASGRTGREVVDVCLEAGRSVRAQTTSRDAVESLEIQGADEVVVADVMAPADADRLVEGVDAVVCTVGESPDLSLLVGDREPVDGEGVMNLVDACLDHGVDRFVLESAIGINESRDGMPTPFRKLLGSFGIVAAKERGEETLRQSGLTDTIIRPGGLTDGPATGDLLVGEGGDTVSGTVSRADVARLLVAALFTPESEGRAFEVVSRDGVRGAPTGLVDLDWELPGDELGFHTAPPTADDAVDTIEPGGPGADDGDDGPVHIDVDD